MHVAHLSAHPEHAEIVAHWIFDTWGDGTPDGRRRAVERVRERLDPDSVPLTLVAMDAGVPVGTVSLFQCDLCGWEHLTPWLAALYVAPAARHRGVASALVRKTEEVARSLGYEHVYLQAQDARGLYARHGWRVIDHIQTVRGATAVMERDLRDLPSVLYRADGSTTVGLGHIAHAIRLDRVLRDSGVASVRLVGRLDDSTAAFAEDAGLIPHWPLERTADEPDQILAALDETRASFIAFNLPRELLETAEPSLAAVAASGVPQVHFDNPMQSSRYGDLVVNALPHVDWGVDLSANPRVLEGLDYLLPDPSLAPVGSRERGADVERVLVSMGGGDESNLTSIVMRTLDAVGFVGIVDVVVGAASRHLDVVRSLAADVRCEARVHQQLLSLAPLVAEADLAFSALGLTTYEFAAAGLPAAILAGTELNARVADIYAKSGTACSLGLYQDRSPDELVLRVGELLADGAGRRSMSRRGPRLVDGLGAQRLLILLKGLLHG